MTNALRQKSNIIFPNGQLFVPQPLIKYCQISSTKKKNALFLLHEILTLTEMTMYSPFLIHWSHMYLYTKTTFMFLIAESPYQPLESFFCLESISWRKIGKGKSDWVWFGKTFQHWAEIMYLGVGKGMGRCGKKGELFKIRWLNSRGSWLENIGKTSSSIKIASEYWEMNWTFQLGTYSAVILCQAYNPEVSCIHVLI